MDTASTAPILRTWAMADRLDPNCRARPETLYRFGFGAVGLRVIYVWCDSVEAGLEECGEWLAEHAPGYFVTPETEDEPDLTYTESGYLASWEWFASEVTDPAEYNTVKGRTLAELDREHGDPAWLYLEDAPAPDCEGPGTF